MATVNIIFGPAGSYDRPRPTPVIRPRIAENFSGTINVSTQTTNAARGSNGYEEFVQITTDGNIRLAFGENPTATVSGGVLMLANTTRDFAVSPGTKVAIIDV